MKTTNWQIIILSVLLILMAIVFAVSYHFSYLQAKMAPMAISGLLIILTGVQLVREYRFSRKRHESFEQKPIGSRISESFRRYLIQGFWMIGFLLAIAFFGFLTAILLFGIAYMRTHGVNWQKSCLISVLMFIVIYALFAKMLEVELYPGLIPEFFLG